MLENNRFKDMIWANKVQDLKVLVIGLGGIGSWLSLYLTRLGCNVYVNDGDTVNRINFSGQLYDKKMIGVYKTNGIVQLINNLTFGGNIHSFSLQFITENSLNDIDAVKFDIIISCVDNMETRKLLYSYFENNYKRGDFKTVFIDGRLLADQFSIYTVYNKETLIKYHDTLFNDNDIPEESCTAKQTSHIAAMIGSYITQIITNYASNVEFEHDVLDIPFHIHFYGPTFELTIEK